MIAAALAGGQSTHEIQAQGAEYAVSQVCRTHSIGCSTPPATSATHEVLLLYPIGLIMLMQSTRGFSQRLVRTLTNYVPAQVYLAIAASKLGDLDALERTVSAVIEDLHGVEPLVKGGSVSYPGEGMIKTRAENLAKGVPVDKQQWEELLRK